MTTSRPASLSATAACNIAAVFPTPGAMPRKTFNLPCFPRLSGVESGTGGEAVSEEFSFVTPLRIV
jgi:hypothetical protein